jgi:hypothetical protein
MLPAKRGDPMLVRSLKVLTLLIAFVSCATPLTLRAQETSSTPSTLVDRCVQWLKATVPSGVQNHIDPADFCPGLKRAADGWYSVQKCGDQTQTLPGTASTYCASSGRITGSEAWAVGFSSKSSDGGDFLVADPAKTALSRQNASVLYSRTALWIESLKVPAGIYDLTASKTPNGWQLTVVEKEETSGPQHPGKEVGTVELKGTASDPGGLKTTTHLVISTRMGSERCNATGKGTKAREIEFIYGSADLYMCVHPEQAPPEQQTTAANR